MRVTNFLLFTAGMVFASEIRGTVTDVMGAAIPGSPVELTSSTGAARFAADAAGRFVFKDLLAGTYSLKITAEGWRQTHVEGVVLAENTTREFQAIPLEIDLSRVGVVRWKAEQPGSGVIRGRLSFENLGSSETIARTNLRIDVFDVHNELITRIATDSEGRFVLERLPPGPYRLRFQEYEDYRFLPSALAGEYEWTLTRDVCPEGGCSPPDPRRTLIYH